MNIGRCTYWVIRMKKRYKRRKVTVCSSRGKGKKRRVKVVKKIVQVKCPPPEVSVTTPTVVGPTGPQGKQGIQGVHGVQAARTSRSTRRASRTSRTSGATRSSGTSRSARRGGTSWTNGCAGCPRGTGGCRTTGSSRCTWSRWGDWIAAGADLCRPVPATVRVSILFLPARSWPIRPDAFRNRR